MEDQSAVKFAGANSFPFRIAHFFDDDKFIDMAIRLFESVIPGQSEYFILQHQPGPFIHVTSALAQPVVGQSPEKDAAFIARIESDFEAVFVHALSFKRQCIVLALSPKIVKAWFIWGYDLYAKWPFFYKMIFEKETLQYIDSKEKKATLQQRLRANALGFKLFHWADRRRNIIPQKFQKILDGIYLTPFYKAVRAMDIVVPVVPTEYQWVQKMRVNLRYAPFTYGTLEHLLGDKIDGDVLGAPHILVGNSADPANNHVEVFRKLASIGLGTRKVYVPLSYAGNAEYKAFVIEKGHAYLGKNFVPLTDFMKLEKYNEIVMSCGFAIFNHVRQQAVGNIILMGCMGAKLFLNEKSTVYDFYRGLGIKVFSTNTLGAADLTHLDTQTWKHNRKIFFEHYSTLAVQEKAKRLLEIVADEINKKHV